MLSRFVVMLSKMADLQNPNTRFVLEGGHFLLNRGRPVIVERRPTDGENEPRDGVRVGTQ